MTMIQPGDRVQCYQYTLKSPSRFEIGQTIKNPWVYPANATWTDRTELSEWNQLPCWTDWVMVVLRVEGDYAFVTSTEFPQEMQRQGVPVPLTHCEVLEQGYGLPEGIIGSNVAPIQAAERRAVKVEQRSIL